jgi:LAO/AO transport system kinase
MTKESIIKDLVEKVVNKETHAAAKLISILENDLSSTQNIYSALLPHLNKIVPVIGFTGPPGAGKSTIIDKLIFELSKKNEQIGVLLIDPSSPVSGGAILGDRIRMTKHSLNKNVFIRSMGNRGHSGGLSLATNNAIRILKVLGCKYIFIETVGVGQSDIDIVNIADVAVLVLLPDAGGNIQAL